MEAIFRCVMVLTACTLCSGDRAQDRIIEEEALVKYKQNDLEYGEQLSSVEVGSNRKKLRGKSGLNLASGTGVTKCTTDVAITVDPSYVPSSSETEKDEEDYKGRNNGDRSDKNEKRDKEGENSEKENSKTTSKKRYYAAPPKMRKPDHYIDDA